jgi:hypothetical protein
MTKTITQEVGKMPVKRRMEDDPAEWLRSFKGCENYSDEQAVEIVQAIEKLTLILFDFTCEQCGTVIDNQLVIPSQKEKRILNLAA